jgi:hypothetical protein
VRVIGTINEVQIVSAMSERERERERVGEKANKQHQQKIHKHT